VAVRDAADEAARVAALRAFGILDTPPEQDFDDLVQLAASVCETPIAAVALVDENRVWFKARLGVDIVEIPRTGALAAESIRHADVFVVTDASAHERYAGGPLEELGIRFFAGAPLLDPEGRALGAVCVLDRHPRELSPVQAEALRAIARQVMTQLHLRRVSAAESVARRRFRTLVEQLPGATYIEELGAESASYMSPQIQSLTGYSPEEWVSDPDFFSKALHPDDCERVLAAFANVHDSFGLVQIEYRLVANDGRVVWIHDEAGVARNEEGLPLYVQGYMADVTRRKESEHELHQAQERYRTLAEQLPLVTYVDGNEPGEVANYISPQIETLVGYTAEEWLADGRLFESTLHPEDRDGVLDRIARGKAEARPLESEYRMVGRDGRVIWVRDIAVPVRDETGRVRCWQGYVVDVTERRAIEEERDRLLENERAQNDQLRELDQLKDEFVAVVSHELRTPLTSILGYLELALEDAEQLDDQHRNFLTVVERNANRLMRLVGDLLFVAQVEAGKLTLEPRELELEALVAESVEAAGPLAAQRGVALGSETELDGALTGDPARLAQLVDNLISNAIKFTPAGGSVVVRLGRANGSAVLEVEDTGMGISAEEQKQLFERFYRTRSAAEKAIQGTGLGLSIAQAIVHAHGGQIGVRSKEGVGTTFHVELPLHAGSSQHAPDQT
jgi:PAS domain S-box-containing protein